jgi:citronellol/citronellal dehydrogenase
LIEASFFALLTPMSDYDSIFRPGLFEGKTILITGGGTGLGRCTAHELAHLGACVVIAARREDVLVATAEEIRGDGGQCETRVMDITDDASVSDGIASICDRVGRIDGLFNNAGGQFAAPAAKLSMNAWQKVVDLNLHGTFRVTRAVFDASMKENGGSIVSMLSDIRSGYVGMSHSAAARAGIQNLTITLALEWARFDIRLNCIAPGTIQSSGMLSYPEPVQESAVRGAGRIPAARLGTESEVSAVVTFLLSPAAAFVTGQSIAVDGGSSFQKSVLFDVAKHAPTTRFDGFHHKSDWSQTPFTALERDGSKEP